MKLEEITRAIIHINFPSQEELTSTFLRFQEHFESPEFRGKIFTLEEYKKWYTANSPKGKETGEFTYYSDWRGFNVPSHVLKPFYEGKFNPLSEREAALLDAFKEKSHPFYIIGTFGEVTVDNLNHEIAHGLFFTNRHYRQEVLRVLNEISIDIRSKINGFFQNSGGYHPEVWDEETHAYLMHNPETLQKKAGVEPSSVSKITSRLNLLFNQYFNSKN